MCLPTDIHLVEYEVEGKLYVDAIRAYKMSDIFDGYYDKLKRPEVVELSQHLSPLGYG